MNDITRTSKELKVAKHTIDMVCAGMGSQSERDAVWNYIVGLERDLAETQAELSTLEGVHAEALKLVEPAPEAPQASKDRVSDFYLESTLNSINLASALDSQLISTAFLRMLLIELIERRAVPEPAQASNQWNTPWRASGFAVYDTSGNLVAHTGITGNRSMHGKQLELMAAMIAEAVNAYSGGEPPVVYPRFEHIRSHSHTCANVQGDGSQPCDCGAVVNGVAVSAQPPPVVDPIAPVAQRMWIEGSDDSNPGWYEYDEIDVSTCQREGFEPLYSRDALRAAQPPPAAPRLALGQMVTDGLIVAIYAGEEGAEFKLLRHNFEIGMLCEVRRPWNMHRNFRPATYEEMCAACPHDWLNRQLCDTCRYTPTTPAECAHLPTQAARCPKCSGSGERNG